MAAQKKNNMANHTTHRRILASPDPPNSSSMDPILKRHPKPTSNHSTNSDQDPKTLYKSCYMSSKPNSNDKVTSRLTYQKPTNYPPSASTDAHLQVKGMSLSADLDTCGITLVKSKHHQKLKTFDPRAEKNSKANGASRQKVKKLSSHEWVEEKKVEEVRVSENKKKEADGEGKMGRELQDLVESVDKEKRGRVCERKRVEVFGKAKGSKELKGLITEGSPDIKRVTVSLEGGRRRSCSDSQVELADFLKKNGARVVSVDMPPFMQIHAVDCARKTCDSLEKFTAKTLAFTLKKEFDGVYGPAWHCIVGTSFGSFVTHSVGGFMYFSMDQKLYVLLFKTTVQRAD